MGSSTMVEHLLHYPKVGGLSLVTATSTGRQKMGWVGMGVGVGVGKVKGNTANGQ